LGNSINPTYFRAATVYARKISVREGLVRLSGVHRGKIAKIDNGYIIIEEQWFSKNP
jgi:hypothetical protein